MAFFSRKPKERKPDKILTVGLIIPVRNLDPRNQQDHVNMLVLSQVFDAPYRASEAGSDPEPVLFDALPRKETPRGDRQVYSVRLRKGRMFSDGTKLTADLVMTSLRSSSDFSELADVEVDGDNLVFVLERPNAHFELVLSQSFCSVVLQKDGALLGTGPYRLIESSEDGVWRVVRNEHHPADPKIDEIRFVLYEPDADGSPTRLVEAVNKGEVDLTSALSRDDVSRVSNVRKSFQPGRSTAILYIDCSRAPFDDPAVRRAVASAIDRSAITRMSYENALAFTATSILPPMMGTWNDGIRHNPSQAKQDLAATGKVLPERLRMLVVWGPRPYLPHPASTANAIAQQLGALGVLVETVTSRDAYDFYAQIASGGFDLALAGWIADTPDAVDFLSSLVSSDAMPEIGASAAVRANYGHFSDPQVDAAIAACRKDASPEQVDRIMSLLTEATPLVPLMYGPTVAVHSWNLKNFTPSQVGFHVFADMDLED